MNLIIKRGILIPRAFPFYSRIKQVLDIENPAYGKALNLGLPLYNIDPSIRCYKEVKQGLIVPIGFIAELMKIKQKYNLDFEIEDHRCAQEPRYSFSFFGELRPEQERAVDHMFRFSCGVLEAPGGSGKTVMALKLIEQANYRTLILVHTKDLMLQWQDRIRQFMKREATLVGSGIEDYSGDIVIAMLQTLHKRFEAGNDMDTNFGCVISDEVHHIPAKTFREVISHYYPKKLYGLTATPQRSDGMEILIFFLIGPIVHNVTDEELVQAGKKINPVVFLPKKSNWPQ